MEYCKYVLETRYINCDSCDIILLNNYKQEVYNVYEMFHTRHMLHLRAYKHKTCSIVEEM